VTVGERKLAVGQVEVKSRTGTAFEDVSLEKAVDILWKKMNP
jgi:hypothetical protein